jgi:hypothetical protein
MNEITVFNQTIKHDADGRFCLNDIHKAAMAVGKANPSQSPGNFLRNAGVAAFVQNLTDTQNCESVVSIKGGVKQGTYATELVALHSPMLPSITAASILPSLPHRRRAIWKTRPVGVDDTGSARPNCIRFSCCVTSAS